MTTANPAGGKVAAPIEARVILWGMGAAFFWGTSYIAAKFVVQSLPPFTAAGFRFLVVAAVLLSLAQATGQWQKVERGDWKWLALAGFFQTGLYFALQYAGVRLTTAMNTSVIVNSRSIFVVILSYLILHEVLTSGQVFGIVLAFAGVVVLTTEGSLANLSFHSGHAVGNFIIVLNALSGALGLVLTKKVLAKFRPFPALVYTQSLGALALLPLEAIEIAVRGGIPAAPPLPWLVLVYQALFCSIVPHWLWMNVVARIEASRASVLYYMSPVMTVVLSYFFLGEKMTVYFFVGAALVLGGAYMAMYMGRRGARG